MQNRKYLFILPNAFTATSILFGVYAIILATGAQEDRFYKAAIAIFFAVVCDALDGRVARMTRTQSEFGVQLDSLADVISFGAAPAVILYQWALEPLGTVGVLAAGLFAVCGALRLARFNVLAARNEPGHSRYFVGLPIPVAAAVAMTLIVADVQGELGLNEAAPAIITTTLLSLLMVSTIKYRTFKDLRPTPRSILSVGFILSVLAMSAAHGMLIQGLLALQGAYLLIGVLGSAAHLVVGRRRAIEAGLHEEDDHDTGEVEEDETSERHA